MLRFTMIVTVNCPICKVIRIDIIPFLFEDDDQPPALMQCSLLLRSNYILSRKRSQVNKKVQ